MHGTNDDPNREIVLTLKARDVDRLAARVVPTEEEAFERIRKLFLDKLHAQEPDHPFCRIAQERGEWTPPTTETKGQP